MSIKQKIVITFSVLFIVLITQTTLLWGSILLNAKNETTKLLQLDPDRAGKILANNGDTIAYIRGNEFRLNLLLKDIPNTVKLTLLAVEDKRFYEHNGVDLKGTLRATYSTLTSKNTKGGSTLTQQLVKNLRLSNALTEKDIGIARAKNLGRKVTEAATSLEIEKQLTKDEIILKYLDTSYFGNGAWGLAAASQRYFSKTPIELNWQEAATLVALLKSPTLYDPLNNPNDSKQRRNLMLDLVQKSYPEALSLWALAIYKDTPLTLKLTPIPTGCRDSNYPVLCNWITKKLMNDPALGKTEAERKRVLYSSGLVIQTTLDPKLQDTTEKTLKELPLSKTQGAAVALVEPGTGKILAMAQNTQKSLEVNLADPIGNGGSGRQAGSTYKLFTLIAALEQGKNLESTGYYSPGCYKSTIFNNPTQRNCFTNTEPSASGYYSLKTATAYSVNTFFIKLGEEVGLPAIIETASRLGVPPRTKVGPKDGSVILGSLEVTPLQMAAAYATVASAGTYCEPWIVKTVYLKETLLLDQKPKCTKVLSDSTAILASRALSAATTYGTGTRANIGKIPVAGKTGTTNNSADLWFDGYNHITALSLWVGDIRGAKYSVNGISGQNPAYGGRVAAPIAGKILSSVYEQQLENEKSINLQKIPEIPDNLKNNTNLSKAFLTQQNFIVKLSPQLSKGTTYPKAGQPALSSSVILLGINP